MEASTLSQVGGPPDARLDLSSGSLNLDDVEGEVVLERLNLEVEDLPITERMPTRVVASYGVARIESWTWESEGYVVRRQGGRSGSPISRRRFWRTEARCPVAHAVSRHQRRQHCGSG